MNIRKQSGLTLLGFLMLLVLGLFFAYTGMKTIPSYLEYNALLNALRTVQSSPDAATWPPSKIRDRIQRSLWVSYASGNITDRNIRITRDEGLKIQVAYEVRKTWIANIDLIMHFNKTVKLGR